MQIFLLRVILCNCHIMVGGKCPGAKTLKLVWLVTAYVSAKVFSMKFGTHSVAINRLWSAGSKKFCYLHILWTSQLFCP